MALIKCSECSAEISDKASCCPKCGAPIAVHKWRCNKCGNIISEEPCPYCSNAQTTVNTNTVAYESSVSATPAFVAKNKRNLRMLITILVIAAVAIIIAIFVLQNSGNAVSKDSHDNCMFIGYADPNYKLDGNAIISLEPKYGYRPVYVKRDDIYNTYHFH